MAVAFLFHPSSSYDINEVVDDHERVEDKVYYPSMTGRYFYAEVQKHTTSGIYYVDAYTATGEE